MHVPDGFLDAPTSVATGVVAAAGVAVALRGARRELDDRTAPMAGLVATFVFAGQMMNFPVAGGTSGHLLGGALAAVLVGPWTGVLCLATVLLVQGLFMADGGITALGTNVTLMGLVGVGVGWLVFVAVRVGAAQAARLGRPGGRHRRRCSASRSPRSSSPACSPSAAPPPSPRTRCVTAMVGWHVADRPRRGRDHRPGRRRPWSPYAPTSCTAPARPSPRRTLEVRSRPAEVVGETR